jgi:hypothetical protein
MPPDRTKKRIEKGIVDVVRVAVLAEKAILSFRSG